MGRYVGHGSGAQFIKHSVIRSLRRCAVVLLMGCSSGACFPPGEYESDSIPVTYAFAGCPSYVVNLWDVFNNEINQFTLAMLETFFRQRESLCAAVNAARQHVKFQYLTGAAPVVYGLPVYVEELNHVITLD